MEFTKERLLKIQSWSETYGPGSNVVLPAEEAEELARIALASLEAEPDYIRYYCGCCGWETIEDWRENDACPKCNHKPMEKMELFTAPPALVVPEEITDESTEQRLMGRRWAPSFSAGWNACRAAMLEGGKS
ncbi:Valyl-tRNA synthetase [Escherichia coli]|nr:Valyl-tRNA synthetase [Escherichia coli]CAD6090664.1 Valyl-tRNA synthetase [Escherichia coli]CAD6122357.1 Valyl-tRNA synthetase [Escherichia coli]